jgi:hypothetical protein
MRRLRILGLSVAAWAVTVYVLLPPARQRLGPPSASGVRGAIHVHTRRSDGSGTPEQVAAAAAKAGLQFVILTDHGDGTREPARPAYYSGVLVVDALEVSAEEGHVVALGLPKTPYPLGGAARDIVEDVARMGGMSVAAHPGSVKPQLRWSEWTSLFNGLEWLNGDSEWRDEPWSTRARVLLTYPLRPVESLGVMLDRPDALLARWDALTVHRRVVALAGTDAHARLDLSGDDSSSGLTVSIPGYEPMFSAFSITATGVTFARVAAADSEALLEAIRGGHVYSTVDALATPGVAAFTARRGGATWMAGDLIPPDVGDIELQVEHNGPPGSRIVLIKDGQTATTAADRRLKLVVPATRAVYRVEIQLPRAPGNPPVPWVVTNPIYIRHGDDEPDKRGDATSTAVQYEDGEARGWRIETSPRSKAALDVARTVGGTELLLRWAIGGTRTESPYAAVAMPAGDALPAYDRLMFTARADRSTRVSVQFRLQNGSRWRRSVHLDGTARPIVVFFDEVRPIDPTSERRLPLGQVRDILFVVDTVNAAPGSSGQFRIDDVKYGR